MKRWKKLFGRIAMPERVAILTAVYDHYDELKPICPQEGFEVEWIAVTDDPFLDCPGWKVVHEARPGIHPNRAAKRPKFLPWEYTTAEYSIWLDASFRVVDKYLARDTLPLARPIAQFKHPWRDCLFDEADESAKLLKYAPAHEVIEQRDLYREWGHPPGWGLWATGVIVREHTERVKAMGYAWLEETDSRTFQDQISQPYVLRTSMLRPWSLPGNHLANHWLQYEGSVRH